MSEAIKKAARIRDRGPLIGRLPSPSWVEPQVALGHSPPRGALLGCKLERQADPICTPPRFCLWWRQWPINPPRINTKSKLLKYQPGWNLSLKLLQDLKSPRRAVFGLGSHPRKDNHPWASRPVLRFSEEPCNVVKITRKRGFPSWSYSKYVHELLTTVNKMEGGCLLL